MNPARFGQKAEQELGDVLLRWIIESGTQLLLLLSCGLTICGKIFEIVCQTDFCVHWMTTNFLTQTSHMSVSPHAVCIIWLKQSILARV